MADQKILDSKAPWRARQTLADWTPGCRQDRYACPDSQRRPCPSGLCDLFSDRF